MDSDLLGEDMEGSRTFWRIARSASDPGLPRKSLDGKSVVEVVARLPGYHHTGKIYASELFSEVLQPNGLTLSRRDELLALVLKRLNLYEPTPEDRWIAQRSKRALHELATPTLLDLQDWLFLFQRKRNIDHVLLLCLLYMRALASANLDEAILFRSSLFYLLHRFCNRPGFDGDTIALLEFMILRRVILGQTSLDHSDQALAHADLLYVPDGYKNPDSEARMKEYEWRRWIAACRAEVQANPISTKIVRRTPQLQAFFSERHILHEQALLELKAEHEESWRRYLEKPVSTYQRFMELPGHREPWRPGDY
ncbi:hypothetical protein [Pseudoxanthomonas mexicana]